MKCLTMTSALMFCCMTASAQAGIFGHHKSADCGCAPPTCAAPVVVHENPSCAAPVTCAAPVVSTCDSCNTCAPPRRHRSCLSKLFSCFSKKSNSCGGCDTCSPAPVTCAAPVVPTCAAPAPTCAAPIAPSCCAPAPTCAAPGHGLLGH